MRPLRMLLHSFAFFAILGAAVLAARAPAQQPSPPAPAPASAQTQPQTDNQPQPPLRFVQKEMWIPAPQAFPNGLDSLEVYVDRPGRHPLVVLTHGTSGDPDERAHVTPWGQVAQAQWFARRGYVAIVVVRQGYGRPGGKQDSTHGGCRSGFGSFEEAGEASVDDLRAAMTFAQRLPEV